MSLEERNRDLIPPHEALGIPAVTATAEQVGRIRNGSYVSCPPMATGPPKPGQRVMALDPEGGTVALMEIRPDRNLHPLRVFPAD